MKFRILLNSIVIILLSFLFSIFTSYYLLANDVLKANNNVHYKIEKGLSVTSIVNNLCAEEMINYCWLVKIWIKIISLFLNFHIHYGMYDFSQDKSTIVVLNRILNGDKVIHTITINSCIANVEVKKIIENELYLSGYVNIDNIDEGYLFPDTYHFKYLENRQNIIDLMHRKSIEQLDYSWNEYLKNNKEYILKNKKEFLILSSIVESESGNFIDMRKIAAVFLNRLKKGMRMQSDTTVIYGMKHLNGQYNPDYILSSSDIEKYHQTNTYRFKGLPSNAICSPSQKAMQAVAEYCKDFNYLYFIANKQGEILFAKTYKEHKINIKKNYGK